VKLFRVLSFLLVLPFLWVSGRIHANKTFDVRYYRLQRWCQFGLAWFGLKLKVYGAEHIPDKQPVFIVSNHQGTIDPLLVIASFPYPTSFISKVQNKKFPGIGLWGSLIEIIFFDRDTKEGNIFMLREAARYLKNNRNLLVFPEGTRSKSDQLSTFKSGALQPAVMTKSTIVPVTLNKAYALDVRDKIHEVSITYHKPITFDDYQGMNYEDLSLLVSAIVKTGIKN
jgi:1-acyl-sn-glycerol-3-phosphate acyltransferase